MGQHYVPQQYLKGFEAPEKPGAVWTYNKDTKVLALIPIKVIAQERGYYDTVTENELSVLVEGPALRALQRLRRHELLSVDDHARMALYVATMMMRVPMRRRKALEMVPKVLAETVSKFRAQLDKWAQSSNANKALVARRLCELDRAKDRFARNPPQTVVNQIRSPWPNRQYVGLIFSMMWRGVVADSRNMFLTSDNPAFFFEAYGLGRPEAEITFPLASDVALLMNWQGPRGGFMFVQAKPALVREVNRRVASGAERFVFCHEKSQWIATLAQKPQPFLSRIHW